MSGNFGHGVAVAVCVQLLIRVLLVVIDLKPATMRLFDGRQLAISQLLLGINIAEFNSRRITFSVLAEFVEAPAWNGCKDLQDIRVVRANSISAIDVNLAVGSVDVLHIDISIPFLLLVYAAAEVEVVQMA